jgi:hypothetical protein
LRAEAASVSFGNVLIAIGFFPALTSFDDWAARKSRLVVPDSTETVLPERSASVLMFSGFPAYTIRDCPTLR